MSKAPSDHTTLWVGNLDRRVTEYQVIKLFSRFGKIVREDFLWHKTGPREGQPRGCCFVEYATRAEAVTAMAAMNGTVVMGRPLRVREANKRTAPAPVGGPAKPYDRVYRSDEERSKHVAETKAREASQEQAAKREKVTLMSAAASAIRMKLEMMRQKQRGPRPAHGALLHNPTPPVRRSAQPQPTAKAPTRPKTSKTTAGGAAKDPARTKAGVSDAAGSASSQPPTHAPKARGRRSPDSEASKRRQREGESSQTTARESKRRRRTETQ